MTAEKICDTVSRIKSRYDFSDVYSLCRDMHILLLFYPMGDYEGACKGFFLLQSRIPSITVNSDLSESARRIVAAHELGHAVLHCRQAGTKAFRDFDVFDSRSAMEYEANLFAAELLIDDRELADMLKGDISLYDAARRLYVPPELLDFKLKKKKKRGCEAEPPMIAQSEFLKKMSVLPCE